MTPTLPDQQPVQARRQRAARLGPAVVAASATVALAACLPGGAAEPSGSPDSTPTVAQQRSDTKGGVLRALSLGPVLTWDPQRIGSRQTAAFAGRLFIRTLTAYAPSTDPTEQGTLVGDLATDTGKPSSDLKTWTFTLRDGPTWQDGSEITCEDVRYGISRTFAVDDITGGPTDALAVLDVPKKPDGTSAYLGPYATGKPAEAGIAAFDKAVTCSGSTITFRLSTPVSDFNEMVTQPAFAPYKKSQDKGNASTYTVFSSGPYMLKGEWETSSGAVFVRNPEWQAAGDPVRKAYPNEIQVQEGIQTQTVAQQIMADGANGRTSVSLDSAPPAIQQHITAVEDLRDRSINPSTGLVDYLVPNVKAGVMRDPEIRKALAVATNREAYVAARGGSVAALPALSLIPQSLAAYPDTDPVGGGIRGDAEKSRALLKQAPATRAVKIRVAYRSSETADKAMAALAAGWREGGFDPQLIPVDDEYFTLISRPEAAKNYDVIWSNWEPAWASASTVLPPLFDSTINITAAGPGRNYGYWVQRAVDLEITRIGGIADRAEREKAWGALDTSLREQAAYIPLADRRALYIAGSSVRNFSGNEVLAGSVEFADIAVEP